jgi:hypothetical protein
MRASLRRALVVLVLYTLAAGCLLAGFWLRVRLPTLGLGEMRLVLAMGAGGVSGGWMILEGAHVLARWIMGHVEPLPSDRRSPGLHENTTRQLQGRSAAAAPTLPLIAKKGKRQFSIQITPPDDLVSEQLDEIAEAVAVMLEALERQHFRLIASPSGDAAAHERLSSLLNLPAALRYLRKESNQG